MGDDQAGPAAGPQSTEPPSVESQLTDAVARYEALGWPRPEALLVSGSGMAVELAGASHGPVPLQRLLPFPIHAVVGHPLDVVLLEPEGGRPVLYQRGRLHSYQGYDAAQTVFAVRLARLLGAKTLVMTNAAGGLDPAFSPGDLVLVEDHLNLIGLNPLRGELPAAWGPRFPDMLTAYDPGLRELAREKAGELGIALGSGVYAGVAGPSYETPAEVRMLHGLGAHLAGMSTVLEVIAARHMGMRSLVVSLVSNAGAGVTDQPLDHQEVLAAGAAASGDIARLLAALLADPRLVG
jgi:purine-nucleoside phosphorylase